MDDRQRPDVEEPLDESGVPAPVSDPAAASDAPTGEPRPAVDVTKLPPIRRAGGTIPAGGTDWRRWRMYGCGVAAIGLVALLMIGAQMMRKTVWLSYGRTHQLVLTALGGATPRDRMETRQNLERLTVALRSLDEPYALMGEFQREVAPRVADGQLDPTELKELNAWIEAAIADRTTPAGDSR
jgi:hypothetical protein